MPNVNINNSEEVNKISLCNGVAEFLSEVFFQDIQSLSSYCKGGSIQKANDAVRVLMVLEKTFQY